MAKPYEDYEQLIEDLYLVGDSVLTKTEQEFIDSLMDDSPQYLTDRQIDWLEALRRKYHIQG